jgi:hypothetical protein
MATDKRELILLRIQAAVAAVQGVAAVYRNRGEIPDDKLPCGILLDGVERKLLGGEALGRNSSGARGVSASIMGLNPQLFFVLKPVPISEASTLGPLLSSWRAALLKAVLRDQQLLSLVGPNGDIEYLGSDTDMQTGRSMEGQLQLNFQFRYVFNPADL